mgnify:CR=1 FL=1
MARKCGQTTGHKLTEMPSNSLDVQPNKKLWTEANFQKQCNAAAINHMLTYNDVEKNYLEQMPVQLMGPPGKRNDYLEIYGVQAPERPSKEIQTGKK